MSTVDDLDALVEYNSRGLSTGIEAEDTEDADAFGPFEIEEPFDPAKIDVVTRTPTVSLLISRLNRGVLDLTPDFQRQAGIWGVKDQSRLIESLLLKIPLPTLYAAESGEDTWLVVDGIQRLSTIARFVRPDLVAEHYGSDSPLRLHGLEYLHAYEGLTFQELPGNLQTRIDETELLVHLIRSGTPEPVKFNIFARINTGGLPLTPQELRHALVPGPARDLLAKLSSTDEFRAATANSIRTDRMQDREMVLRFLAFLIRGLDVYRGDLDTFLREAMQSINQMSRDERDRVAHEFRATMDSAHAIFGQQAFRKRKADKPSYRHPVNKALFEAVSVNLARLQPSDVNTLVSRRKRVDSRFIDLMSDRVFFNSISVGTGDAGKVRIRFATVKRVFEEVLA